MANVSAELQWLVVRKSSRYALRGRTPAHHTARAEQFSRDPGTVSGRNNFSQSGLAGRVVSVNVLPSGAAEIVEKKAFNQRVTRTPVKGGRKKVYAAIAAAVEANGRSDLKRPVLARYARLHRTQQRGALKKK